MFMWGPGPLRRTLPYLKSPTILLKDNVCIMEVHYHLHGKKYQTREQKKQDYFQGLRDFYFWEMPKIQYQNPKLQIVRMLDKLPAPFVRFWYTDGTNILFDCFNQTHPQITQRINEIVGKSKERLNLERIVKQEVEQQENPALFGYGRERFCGCEVPGQSPCPGVTRTKKFSEVELDIGGKLL